MKRECVKCRYVSESNILKFGLVFCRVCSKFCPDDPEKADEFIKEKINKDFLNPFRKYAESRGEKQKKGMISKASQGKAVSRAPFGYTIKNKILVPSQNYKEVQEIFQEFLEKGMTLSRLAKKHNLSVNGLKKILKNFTYIGKIRFNNQIYSGNHQPIIDAILFNRVQDKLEKNYKK